MNPAPPVTTARTRRIVGARCSSPSRDRTDRARRRRRRCSPSGSREQGHEVVATREPGGTPLGEAIRDVVLHGLEMTAWAEATLFASARAEHVERVIRPALERGAWVVCDRYVDSSLVYQGIARGLGVEQVLELNRAVTGGLMPGADLRARCSTPRRRGAGRARTSTGSSARTRSSGGRSRTPTASWRSSSRSASRCSTASQPAGRDRGAGP